MASIVNNRPHGLRAQGVRFLPGVTELDDAKWAELKADPVVASWVKLGWLGDANAVAAKKAAEAATKAAAKEAKKAAAAPAAPEGKPPAEQKPAKADKPAKG